MESSEPPEHPKQPADEISSEQNHHQVEDNSDTEGDVTSPSKNEMISQSEWLWPWLVIVGSIIGILLTYSYSNRQPEGKALKQHTQNQALILQAKVVLGLSDMNQEQAEFQLAVLDAAAMSADDARLVAALYKAVDPVGLQSNAIAILERTRETLSSDETDLHDAFLRGVSSTQELSQVDVDILHESGWAGRLLLNASKPKNHPDRVAFQAETQKSFKVYMAMASLILMAGLAGIVFFILAMIRKSEGRLPTEFKSPCPRAHIYLQSFAIYIFAMFVMDYIVGWLPFTSQLSNVLLLSIPVICGLAWPIYRGITRQEAMNDLGLTRGDGVLNEMAAGLVGYITILPIAGMGIMLTIILQSFLPQTDATHPVISWLAEGGKATRILVFVLAAVLAPLFEETMFRGALYRGLRLKMGWVVSGLLMGFIFAVVHPQGVIGIPVLMAMGFGFGLIREWRDSLIASMTAHAIHNGALVILMIAMMGSNSNSLKATQPGHEPQGNDVEVFAPAQLMICLETETSSLP